MGTRPRRRCAWVGDSPEGVTYHDSEWGVPSRDDRHLFEMLILEGAQAGLDLRELRLPALEIPLRLLGKCGELLAGLPDRSELGLDLLDSLPCFRDRLLVRSRREAFAVPRRLAWNWLNWTRCLA